MKDDLANGQAHTTNYRNTFIAVAPDCRAAVGLAPPQKPVRTIARLQYEMILGAPYRFSSDDIIFAGHAEKQGLPEDELPQAREAFFSRGQACLRASPLAKTYGWGFHFDDRSRVAIYAQDSPEYRKWLEDPTVQHLVAMRSGR